tara:strand:- start:114 stop:371 length:258 start_codon:yes stop_codon:yes gene_type:complete
MRAYKGVFLKPSGEERTMYFLKLGELEAAKPGYLNAKTTGTGRSPMQVPGKELVWDLQTSNFRVFNYNTIRGQIVTFEFDENRLI